jgi:hypothetical protein
MLPDDEPPMLPEDDPDGGVPMLLDELDGALCCSPDGGVDPVSEPPIEPDELLELAA